MDFCQDDDSVISSGHSWGGNTLSISNMSARMLFGPYELDLRSGELTKFGHKLRLQEQPFQILALLIERPGEIITREELQKKLWADDTFVDFEHGLNNAIKRLRETLCDSAEKPRYIETIPRRGYRFIATLETPELAAVQPAAAPATHAGVARPARKPVAMLVLLFLIVLATVGIGDSALHPGVRAIAVLPLDNLSGDPNQDYFAAGLTDALTTELARVGSLSVVSRTSAVKYKGKAMADIVHDLNVDAVIEGSVVRSGNRIRITPRLIDARRDRQLWAENYDRDLGDSLKLQTEIAVAVARRVRAGLSPRTEDRLASRPKIDPKAYDLYLRAVPHLGLANQQDNDAAIELLEEAVAADPKFALAYAQLAMEYRTRSSQFRLWRDPANESSSVAIEHALSLDPDLPEAYLARAFVRWTKRHDWPHEAAIADLKHALALNPNLAEAHHQLANVYNHMGLLDVGQRHIEEAVSLDPASAGIRFRVGINLLYQGRWEDALQELRSTKEFFPSLWAYQSAFALLQMGRIQEAQDLIHNAVNQDSPETAGLLEAMDAVLAAKSGDTARADEQIRAAIKRGEQFQHFHHVAYAIGSAYALMDRRDQALIWLRRAADDGFPCYPLFERDHNLDGLRNEPHFVQWMTEMRKNWEHYKALS